MHMLTPENLFELTGSLLASAMRADRVTQEEMARRTGLSQPTISRYANGSLKVPKEHYPALLALLPSLAALSAQYAPARKQQQIAEATAAAPQLFIPDLPKGFSAGPWHVQCFSTGFPERYALDVRFSYQGNIHERTVHVGFGVQPDNVRSSILRQVKSAVEDMRDAAGVIA
jgi:transcriptional regulator with XRE-family HTH domain